MQPSDHVLHSDAQQCADLLDRSSELFPVSCRLQTKVQNALKNLEEYATWMRVLGSYPIGV